MARHGHERPAERGQVLVIFALSVIVLFGFAGLAVDGGSSFAQQRDQQSASDLAALAAANDFLINGSYTNAIARARSVAAANGYTHGANGTTVDVEIDTDNGIEATVVMSALHQNLMASALGMRTWTVTADSMAVAGFPDYAAGGSPFIFSADAFQSDGTPLFTTDTDFGETNGDVPTSSRDLAWTNYGTGNVNTTEVAAIIRGTSIINKQIEFGEYIGQHNNGNHTTLFQDVNTYLSGQDVPAAVVDASGNFVGWSTFHVTSASAGSSKTVRGYFLTSFESARLSIKACAANNCPRYLGSYVLKLTE